MYGPSTGVSTHRWTECKGVWPQDVQRTDPHRQEKQMCKHFLISTNLDGMVEMRSEGETISITIYIAVKTISMNHTYTGNFKAREFHVFRVLNC
jgi:hypothetical protein